MIQRASAARIAAAGLVDAAVVLARALEDPDALDAFLAKYPSSGYKGYALLDRADSLTGGGSISPYADEKLLGALRAFVDEAR